MTCAQTRDVLPLFDEGELDPVMAQSVEQHLDRCGECRALLDLDRELATSLSVLTPRPTAASSRARRVRIRAAIERRRIRRREPVSSGPLTRTASTSLVVVATASLILLLVVLGRSAANHWAASSGSLTVPSHLLLTGPKDGDAPPVWGVPDIWLRPVDPTTLADLPGYPPIDFGHNDTAILTPDGKTLAAFVWPSGVPQSGGELHVVDVGSGADTPTGITTSDYVMALSFSPDGRTLYWVNPAFHEAMHNWPDGWEVSRYRMGSASANVVARLPGTFVPGQARALPNGTLAIYGVPAAPNNISTDAPHLLLIDLTSGQVRTDLRLDGIKDGNIPRSDPPANGTDFETYQPGIAWDIPRERLYVVDPETERIVAVDLAQGRIIDQGDIRPPAAWPIRLLRWLFPAAEAKGGPATREVTELSPDGTRLYLVGTRDGPRWTPTGLTVVDTDGLSLVQRVDLPVSDVALAPDGQRLLLHLWWPAASGTPQRQALATLDARNLAEIGRIVVDDPFTLIGFSPDGQDAYVGRNVQRPDHTAEWQVSAVNIPTQRIVAERGFSAGGAPAYVSFEGVWRNGTWREGS